MVLLQTNDHELQHQVCMSEACYDPTLHTMFVPFQNFSDFAGVGTTECSQAYFGSVLLHEYTHSKGTGEWRAWKAQNEYLKKCGRQPLVDTDDELMTNLLLTYGPSMPQEYIRSLYERFGGPDNPELLRWYYDGDLFNAAISKHRREFQHLDEREWYAYLLRGAVLYHVDGPLKNGELPHWEEARRSVNSVLSHFIRRRLRGLNPFTPDPPR